MSSVLKVSDAAAIGLHAMVLLATRPDKLMSNHNIASTLKVSPAHLSKVLQRLSRAGLVRATRGPGGGFAITINGAKKTLLDVFEAIEGPMRPHDCLLAKSICGGKNCMFGSLLRNMNREAHAYLAKTRLNQLNRSFKSAGIVG